MATNVSYASTITTGASLESLVLHILPHVGKLGDGILNTNGLTAALNAKGTTEEVDGGLEVWEPILKNESSNAKWQGKNDDMNANSQDPADRLRWNWAIFTNSIVLNDLDKAMNKGRAAIKNWLQTLRRQAEVTNKNQFNSAFWKSSPGSSEPNSVPSLISATPTTGTIGGLNRSGNSYLQNGAYTTTVTSIGSSAGISALEQTRIKNSVGTSAADIIIMSAERFSALVGYLATLQRWYPNDKLFQLRIPSIKLGDATVVFENTTVQGSANKITTNYVYGINSDNMWLKVLKDMSGNWSLEMERVNRSLNKAVYYTWAGQLVTNCPRAHFVMTAVTG
jgi:hypothetical protein